jgi:hypothetical protein
MAKGGKRRGGAVWQFADCRRLAIDLGVAAGLGREQAVTLANHLLWFDAVAAHSLGISSLPWWLDRVASGEFRPTTDVRFVSERAGTAVLDGGKGLPPVLLTRAAAIAGEKARELGLGLVVVKGLGAVPSAAPQAAELAIGPFASIVLGPKGAWSLALPSAGGLPRVSDRALSDKEDRPELGPWAPLVPDDGWLVAAIDVPAIETLEGLHARVSEIGMGLDPNEWEARRFELHEKGMSLPGKALKELVKRARALGVPMQTTGP